MAVVTQGELWVKVLEARNLHAADSGGTSDPFITVQVPSHKKTLEGKVVKKTLTPRWNEEFIWPLYDLNGSIVFNVKDWNRFTSNVSIGTANLALETLAPGVVMDQWLPLTGQGEIHVLSMFTPKILPKKADPVRLPSFRLVLERNTYFPGEVVRGNVVFNVNRPREIRGVRVKFHGYSHVRWTEQHGSGKHRHTVVYESWDTYFNVIATVHGNARGSKDKFILEPGAYAWPFQFQLPLNMPPSWEAQIGRNRYMIAPYVDIPWAADKDTCQMLNIVVHYPSLQRLLTQTADKATGGLVSSRKIRCTATIPEIVYTGDAFSVNVVLENDSDKAVKELDVKLNGYGRFYAGGKSRHSKYCLLSTRIKGAGFPVPPGGRWQGQVQVVLPEGTIASIPPQICRILNLTHLFKTKAITEGNIFTKQESTVTFPILIGHRPFIEYVAPTVIQSQVAMVQFGQLNAETTNQLLSLPVTTMPGPDGNMGYVMSRPVPAAVFNQTYAPEQWNEAPPAQSAQPQMIPDPAPQ